MTVKRPFIRYPGSKWRLAEWIASFIPGDHHSYGEPFGGSAAVLLRKDRSSMENINDMSGEIVNLFTVMRDCPDELIRRIELTPWSYHEFKMSMVPCDDPIERARRFYCYCWMSIYPFRKTESFRRQIKLSIKDGNVQAMSPAAKTFRQIAHLWQIADRLRGVVIENMDALEFIDLYDNEKAFFYIDPPYPFETRKSTKGMYPHDSMTDDCHAELASKLQGITGMAVVSGYACDLYTDLYESEGWARADMTTRINSRGSAVESLWISPRTQEALERGRVERQSIKEFWVS